MIIQRSPSDSSSGVPQWSPENADLNIKPQENQTDNYDTSLVPDKEEMLILLETREDRESDIDIESTIESQLHPPIEDFIRDKN